MCTFWRSARLNCLNVILASYSHPYNSRDGIDIILILERQVEPDSVNGRRKIASAESFSNGYIKRYQHNTCLWICRYLIALILDEDEIEVAITESNQLFNTSSGNLLGLGHSSNSNKEGQSTFANGSNSPGSQSPNISINGSDLNPGLNISNGSNDNTEKVLGVPNKSSPNTPRVKGSSISTYQDQIRYKKYFKFNLKTYHLLIWPLNLHIIIRCSRRAR